MTQRNTTTANTSAESGSETADVDVIVIGAGMGGLYAVHRLRDNLGLRVQAFEAASGVSGTWYWNRYPGARTDSPYTAYRYSWSDDLVRDWTWTERYPSQPEVLKYLEFVADRLDLRRSYCFNARVTAAEYDDTTNTWTVRTADGTAATSKFLVSALGLVSAPITPRSTDWTLSPELSSRPAHGLTRTSTSPADAWPSSEPDRPGYRFCRSSRRRPTRRQSSSARPTTWYQPRTAR